MPTPTTEAKVQPSTKSQIRLAILGSARDGSNAVIALAEELSRAVKANEPGVLNYTWSKAQDSDSWVIEEEYQDFTAFSAHMEQMKNSGKMRELGKAFQIEKVLVLTGEPDVVGPLLGPLPTVYFTNVN